MQFTSKKNEEKHFFICSFHQKFWQVASKSLNSALPLLIFKISLIKNNFQHPLGVTLKRSRNKKIEIHKQYC